MSRARRRSGARRLHLRVRRRRHWRARSATEPWLWGVQYWTAPQERRCYRGTRLGHSAFRAVGLQNRNPSSLAFCCRPDFVRLRRHQSL